MTVYADTSFLIPAYIPDEHSRRVTAVLAGRPSITLTPFCRSETANAIYRQVFVGRLTHTEATNSWRTFESDCTAGIFQLAAFPSSAWDRCMDLARRFAPSLGVRTLDSLHVACALELGAEQFLTFDERQARLATAVGLNTRA